MVRLNIFEECGKGGIDERRWNGQLNGRSGSIAVMGGDEKSL